VYHVVCYVGLECGSIFARYRFEKGQHGVFSSAPTLAGIDGVVILAQQRAKAFWLIGHDYSPLGV
jgi:hypothetical protein